jgi:hypothetical protein
VHKWFDKSQIACYTAKTQGKAGESSQVLVVLFRYLVYSMR